MSEEHEIPCVDCIVLAACMRELGVIQHSKDEPSKMQAMVELMGKCPDFLEYVRDVVKIKNEKDEKSSV